MRAPRLYPILAFLVAPLLFSLPLAAQEQVETKPLPVITGYGSFVGDFQSDKQTITPVLQPILLVPLGNKFLVEAGFEMKSEMKREDGVWGPRAVEKNFEFLELNYFANGYLTLVGGRFLTPFGIFNERLDPPWVKNLQTPPLIRPFGDSSSNGGMARGAIPLSSAANLTYSAYYSAASERKTLEADRSAGGRWSLFFPGPRFEAGVSFRRMLGDERFNLYSLDGTWNARAVPLDVRSEYMWSPLGSGYWIEGAYRLSALSNPLLRRSQPVARVEQFFAKEDLEEGLAGVAGDLGLPAQNTQRVMLGWNYYIRNWFKVSFAYGRTFNDPDTRNVWSVGVVYRFLR